MTPVLNWRELEHLASLIQPEILNTSVDRIVVPARPDFKDGFLKGEWIIRLTSRREEKALLISVRARHPYLALYPKKGPAAAPKGTRSPFDLALSKFLKGSRLVQFEPLPNERTVALWFTDSEAKSKDQHLVLLLSLIPAVPEAVLIRAPLKLDFTHAYPVVARSRMLDQTQYTPPDGARSPKDIALRTELIPDLGSYLRTIETEPENEAFTQRLQQAEKALRDLQKTARSRLKQSDTAIRESQNEPEWKHYGDLLKACLHDCPPLENGVRKLWDYTSESWVEVPGDPKLDPVKQIEKYYHLARRKARRLEESQIRKEGFEKTLSRISQLLENPPALGDWKKLAELERTAGTGATVGASISEERAKKKHQRTWMGRSFESKDGWNILVGRSRDENLELTFKVARGNDLWLHLRGRPGAHVVVPVPSGKSVPLETLLDAAHLTIHYSGGQKWGKTEVDYTFKKYVKRIKDSTEASYTQNKTLIIEPDQERLKRLLGQES